MNLQGPLRVCRKSRQAQKGRIEDSFIALRKLINTEQRIGNLKLTLRLSPRYFKGTLPVTESVVLPPNLRDEHHAPIAADNLFEVPIRNVAGTHPRRPVRL